MEADIPTPGREPSNRASGRLPQPPGHWAAFEAENGPLAQNVQVHLDN